MKRSVLCSGERHQVLGSVVQRVAVLPPNAGHQPITGRAGVRPCPPTATSQVAARPQEGMTMTTYRVTGSLTQPVNDLQSANSYLDEPMADYIKYCDEALVGVVLYVRWELTDEASWLVTLVTSRHLTDQESTTVSEWISGQNSDGLGEGFEQQPFAEHEGDDEDDDDWSMSSFDWKTNPCTLRLWRR